MSWSVVTSGSKDNVHDRVNALEPVSNGVEFQPRDDQVAAAKAAAISLIDSGAIGKDVSVSVSLAGHANEDHIPAQGYSPDVISVQVTQIPDASVEQFDETQAQDAKNLE